MMSAYAGFESITKALAPRTAVVLGSGLSEAAAEFRESASIAFGDVPHLVPPAVHGHRGRLLVGHWGAIPTLLFLGRVHLYEGHSHEVVAGSVHVAAHLGIKRLVLTNAAGGIHPALQPGSLMAVCGHLKLIGNGAWRSLMSPAAIARPYSDRLLGAVSDLPTGVYAALTGPCYETPAEIRALAGVGANAVGMSTAIEAETAVMSGLEVAAISCITNRAAGLGSTPLAHAEVLANATLAVTRMREMIERLNTL